MTLSTLRQTIWIPNGTRIVQSTIRRCPQCTRFNSRQRQPLMGDLPVERISPSSAFTHAGLDYCGPISTKSKNEKVYVAIFICFSTKAVHLEPVETLTKEACLSILHPHQITRVVEIRTRRGSYVQPVHRLFLFLPTKEWVELNKDSSQEESQYPRENEIHLVTKKTHKTTKTRRSQLEDKASYQQLK